MLKKNRIQKIAVAEYTDIIHEIRNGVLMDIYLKNGEEIKAEPSKE